jgi:hypothetical protein
MRSQSAGNGSDDIAIAAVPEPVTVARPMFAAAGAGVSGEPEPHRKSPQLINVVSRQFPTPNDINHGINITAATHQYDTLQGVVSTTRLHRSHQPRFSRFR